MSKYIFTQNVYIFRQNLQILLQPLNIQVSTHLAKQYNNCNNDFSAIESNTISSSQAMVPMSEFDSAVASEGYLATTIDRKDKNDQCGGKETSFLNGRLFMCTNQSFKINLNVLLHICMYDNHIYYQG